MPVRYGRRRERDHRGQNRDEPTAEFDEMVWRGDSYVFTITALWPYKEPNSADPDALLCHIDFMNVTKGTSGRFARRKIPGRDTSEPDGHLRRHSAMRRLKQLIRNGSRMRPSPIYP